MAQLLDLLKSMISTLLSEDCNRKNTVEWFVICWSSNRMRGTEWVEASFYSFRINSKRQIMLDARENLSTLYPVTDDRYLTLIAA